MLEAVLEALAWAHGYADVLAWVVLALFLSGTVLELSDREYARYVVAGAWVVFAAFWFAQIHHFAFVQKSIIEGVGAVVAVPAAAYVAYLLLDGRDSLFTLSRAVAVMGLVFMPFEMVPFLRQWLVETVTYQTEYLMALLGQHPEVVSGAQACAEQSANGCLDYQRPYRSTFLFTPEASPGPVMYTILIACTGIGSMAIFAGLVAAVDAPLRRKGRALAVSLPIIYALNLVRNVFIALSFGQMRMQVAPELTANLFGLNLASDPAMVSYIWADRIIAQSLSVVALVAITWLVVRELPEVLTVVEDVLYVATGNEYDLQSELDVPGATDPEPPSPTHADD